MADKKVLIADDSALFCRIAGEIVNSAEGFCICASAGAPTRPEIRFRG